MNYNLFNESPYPEWRTKRINKLINILGQDWFNGKTILELACGHGHTGKYFQDLGAIVTCTDGFSPHIPIIKEKLGDKGTVILLNQNEEWNLNKTFDLVIHWGILYHLTNWKRDLRIAINHSNIICLDSEIAITDNPFLDIKIVEGWYGGSIDGMGSRVALECIENIFTECNVVFTRYDDEDLNEYPNIYSSSTELARKFWIGYKVNK